jgi:hypothetical protein
MCYPLAVTIAVKTDVAMKHKLCQELVVANFVAVVFAGDMNS